LIPVEVSTMTRETIAGVIAEYETWMRSWGAAEKTIEARKTLAKARLSAWGLSGFTPESVERFLAGPEPPRKPWSKWTRATYHGHLRDLCAWLYANDHILEDPMGEVRSPKRPKPAPRPLTEAEARRVLAVVEGQTRDWILLAMQAGLRVSEIAKIRGEDITADGIYVAGKGGSEAMLPCHPDLWEMAERYPRFGYWFPDGRGDHINSQRISAIVGQIFRALGITGSIHRCRHYYATNLLRNGEHVRRVQKLMRHANLETTAAYTAVDEDELRGAIHRLPSLNTRLPTAG
jgi:integrase/recombinase XerD